MKKVKYTPEIKAIGVVIPIGITRVLTKAEISTLRTTANAPLTSTIIAKDLPTLPKSAQAYIAEQAAVKESTRLLQDAKNDPNLSTWSKQKIGDTGEVIATNMVKGSGYTDVISIQNASGNGIDIIAKNRQGDYVYMEVKSSKTGNIGGLTKGRQDDMKFFVNDILLQASKGTGRYDKIDAVTKAKVVAMYDDFLKARGTGTTTGTAIGVDLKNGLILVSPWDRK